LETLAKFKSKYLHMINCPKCGKRAKLFGRFALKNNHIYFVDYSAQHMNGHYCYFNKESKFSME